MVNYCSNGFTIKSDIDLLGWQRVENHVLGTIFLTLKNGTFTLESDLKNWPHIYRHYNGYMCFNWNNRLSMLILDNKKEILYMKESHTMPSEITFALNFVLCFIAHENNRIALHGCSYANNKTATIILGNSGDGKSTLLFDLVKNNNNMFVSEEICFIESSNNPQVFLSNKLLRLNKDTYIHSEKNINYWNNDEKINFWNKCFISSELSTKLVNVIVLNKDDKIEADNIDILDSSTFILSLLQKHLYVKSIIKWIPFKIICSDIFRIMHNINLYQYNFKRYPCTDYIRSLNL